MKITIDIPDGMRCVDDRMKRCKLCAYAEHMQACNCRLYGRLLKGGKIPVKCPEWISVEGRKPEGVVLVANFAPGTDGYKKMDVADAFDAGNSDITFYLLNGFDVEYDVTHWMPIPDAPPEKG